MDPLTEVGTARSHIETERLLIRPWMPHDAPEALRIYGDPEVSRWLRPGMDRVTGLTEMAGLLDRWGQVDMTPVAEADPTGHWAVQRRADDVVVGGVSLQFMQPERLDLEIAWQLAPSSWGQGYAAESGSALARWVLHNTDADEVFALVGQSNVRGAATATRVGMEWVGQTNDYGEPPLQIFRLRHADLGVI